MVKLTEHKISVVKSVRSNFPFFFQVFNILKFTLFLNGGVRIDPTISWDNLKNPNKRNYV